jgi:hypothetical protein
MTTEPTPSLNAARLECTYDAPAELIWELLTTAAGLEEWWAPDGFESRVSELELRPGGQVRYTVTATAPEQVAFMRNSTCDPRTTRRRQLPSAIVRKSSRRNTSPTLGVPLHLRGVRHRQLTGHEIQHLGGHVQRISQERAQIPDRGQLQREPNRL